MKSDGHATRKWQSFQTPFLCQALKKGLGLLFDLAAGMSLLCNCIPALAEDRPQPIALLLSTDGTNVWVARQQPPGIAIVNLAAGTVESWSGTEQGLRDLTAWNDQSALALVNDEPSLLIRLDRRTAKPEVIGRWPGVDSGDRVRVSADAKSIAVASLLDRWVRFTNAEKLNANEAAWRQVDVPFSPGEILWLPDHQHLVVADAFGGRLALIDGATAKLVCVRQIPAHNISGLTLGPGGRQVFLTHQTLHRGAHAAFDDIHWGGLLTNVLRSIDVSDFLDPAADLLAHTVVTQLGTVGNAAGDPAGVVIRSDGTPVVAVAGVNELIYRLDPNSRWYRVPVGARPRSFVLTADQKRAVVLNELDDTLSLVSLTSETVTGKTIPIGDQTPATAVARGERLFFNARLSHDGWFSCHSCHTNGHTNGNLVDNLTDGTTGTPKRVLSLRGIRDTAPYGWDGHLPTLADQVRHSITSTMQGSDPSETDVNDLVTFLESLPPWPKSDRVGEGIVRGRAVFERENCIRCHSPTTYTTPDTFDVGLADERGHVLFNPPSLRGLRQGGPYFHSGRAETLSDVVGKFRHQLRQNLTPDDEARLIEFLESL